MTKGVKGGDAIGSTTEKPIGLDDIGKKIAEAKAKPSLPKNGEIGNGRSFDNIKATLGGTDTEYTLRRLARDAPEMLDKIEAGEKEGGDPEAIGKRERKA